MGLGLCSCLWRSSGVTTVKEARPFVISEGHGSLVLSQYSSGVKCISTYEDSSVAITYVSLGYGSLISGSSLRTLGLIASLVFLSPYTSVGFVTGMKVNSISVSLMNVHWSQSAALLANHISNLLCRGVNSTFGILAPL